MAINKKNELGKRPLDLGRKDAIHVAIVSVRAASVIQPGERIGLNEFNEAVPDEKGPGVADPFLKKEVTVGQNLWLLLDVDEVPNVSHVWEHPSINFAPPTREIVYNKYLLDYAQRLGVTYDQFMKACTHVVKTATSAKYPGTLCEEALEAAQEELDRDMWYEWSEETGYQFENTGTSCCPEYEYPTTYIFTCR